MTDRQNIYNSLRLKMEKIGFHFEIEQQPHLQNRREAELKFIHPQLIKRLEEDGHKVRAKKFYIKQLTDEPNSEIGFVTGRSSPLYEVEFFSKPNSTDTFDDTPAWTNQDNNPALDDLLQSIIDYLKTS